MNQENQQSSTLSFRNVNVLSIDHLLSGEQTTESSLRTNDNAGSHYTRAQQIILVEIFGEYYRKANAHLNIVV
ncbi:hypothetical protein G6F56_002847 [Rhizopus delemar]|nr:hypothetical protein G6F56_002847 [Rhizopus delemar]